MTKIQPNYYSIIPATVRYDNKLKSSEKLLYGEITALANKYGYCWAENRYFANLYGVHKITVSNWLSNLEKQGYVQIEIEYIKGTKQVSKRFIYINDTPINKKTNRYKSKDLEGINKNTNTPINENTKEELNTTSINTTSTNNTPAELEERFEKLWKSYPRKEGKGQARKKYLKYIKDGETTDEEIQEGIEAYNKKIDKEGIQPKYIKHGSTWFNNKGWEDEYQEALEQPKNSEPNTNWKNKINAMMGGS